MKTTLASLAALLLAATPARAETPDADAHAALVLATARRVATVEKDLAEIKSRMAALEANPARPPVVSAAAVQEAAYARFRRDVASGSSGVLFVGRPVPTGFSEYRMTLAVDSLDGVEAGVYQCDLAGGVAVMELRQPKPAFATPVRNLIYQFAPRGCPNGNCPK